VDAPHGSVSLPIRPSLPDSVPACRLQQTSAGCKVREAVQFVEARESIAVPRQERPTATPIREVMNDVCSQLAAACPGLELEACMRSL